MSDKMYLGDSVYAEWDGCGITLTTENGYGPSNTIYIEQEVWANLVDYIEQQIENGALAKCLAEANQRIAALSARLRDAGLLPVNAVAGEAQGTKESISACVDGTNGRVVRTDALLEQRDQLLLIAKRYVAYCNLAGIRPLLDSMNPAEDLLARARAAIQNAEATQRTKGEVK